MNWFSKRSLRATTAMLVVVLAAPSPVFALSITKSLRDRGFGDGFVLRERGVGEVFIALPRETALNHLKLTVNGGTTAPTLMRGSMLTSVNGQPVDAMQIDRHAGMVPFSRELAIPSQLVPQSGPRGLTVRFESDLRAGTDPCVDDADRANSIAIWPDTQISVDLDLSKVQSVGAALDLMGQNAPILLPNDKLTPAIMRAALRLGLAARAKGLVPQFDVERPKDAVSAFRVAADSTDKRVFLERIGAERFDVVAGVNADIDAFIRQWGRLPGSLFAADVAAETVKIDQESAAAAPARRIMPFPTLPPAMAVAKAVEWQLPFPSASFDGQRIEGVELEMAVAPDWSGEKPIMTLFVNGEIIGAERLEPGQRQTISAPVPQAVLRQQNNLRVVLQRATSGRFCPGRDDGLSAQILPQSGLRLTGSASRGFGGFAHSVATAEAVRVIIPRSGVEMGKAAPLLTLITQVFSSLSAAQPHDIEVLFDDESRSPGLPELLVQQASIDRFVIDLTAQSASGNALRFPAGSPLMALYGSRQKLTMVVPNFDHLPQPQLIALGLGDSALVADSGVVWQNERRSDGPSYVERIVSTLTAIRERIRAEWPMALGIFIATLALLLLIRAGVKWLSHRKPPQA